MKRLQPVIWTKGTFLSPQYLQLQDRFLENLLQFHLESLAFRPWGFSQLQISQEGLAAGWFGISSASGILPDGLLFDIPGSDGAPPPKILADCFEPDQTTLEMYLAVPQYRERGLNVATSPREGGARYRPKSNCSATKTPVSRKSPCRLRARICACWPKAKRSTATPRCAWPASSAARPARFNWTRASCRRCSISAPATTWQRSRGAWWRSFRRDASHCRPAPPEESEPGRFHRFRYRQFLAALHHQHRLPDFRHLFETRGGHPEALFSAMLALAGALTTFSTKIHPRDLPPYDHDDLGACFTDLDEKLRILLETVVPTNFVSLPLKLVQPSIYATSIDNDKYLVNTKMYLAVVPRPARPRSSARLPQLVKVCSANHIDHLVSQALAGRAADLRRVSPPSAIPIKLNYQYFSLSQSGVAWEAIQRARNLAAYVPGICPIPQLELIILLPQAGVVG